MSDEQPFVTDPSFGEFIVSASGHYDHHAGVWWKPWTDKPDRVVIGYIGALHPEDIVAYYTYLTVDVVTGVLRWHHGMTGVPETDDVIHEVSYRSSDG